ncbi:MAG: SPOR domain-containing protein [Clostridium sp.]|uniref:SPOR domain-containing protein n=1 Tax=Clostridium sp. TaxID=1506 RepID=UPI00302C8D10
MKYTKYSYKKKKTNNKSLVPIAIITALVISLGIGVAWLVYDYVIPLTKTDITTKGNTNPKEQTTTIDDKDTDYVFVQCGYFGNKSYADASYSKVNSEYLSFIIEDEGKYRVSAGIYTTSEGDAKVEELKGKGLEASKMSFDIPSDNSVDKQVMAIVDGYLKIINTLEETDVKSVNTKEFKTYVANLEVLTSGEGIEDLKLLKEHMNALADEITKNEVKSEMSFLYSVLVKYKK